MGEKQRTMSTRAVVEGAVFAAVAVVMYILGPATQMVLTIAYPVPAALITQRHGIRAGIMASIVAALGIGMIMGPLDGLICLTIVGLPGIVLGITMKKGLGWATSTLITGVVIAATTAADFVLGSLAIGISPRLAWEEMHTAMAESVEMSRGLYERFGATPEMLSQLEATMERTSQVLRELLPAFLLLSGLLFALAAYAIVRAVLLRMKTNVQPIDPFARWSMPTWLIWVPIAGLVLPLLGNYLKIDLITAIGNNIFTGSMMLYMVHALSMLWFYMAKGNVPKLMRFIICAFVYMTPLFSGLLPYVGVLDSFYDFRKLKS